MRRGKEPHCMPRTRPDTLNVGCVSQHFERSSIGSPSSAGGVYLRQQWRVVLGARERELGRGSATTGAQLVADPAGHALGLKPDQQATRSA
eukprot:363793-Chlamydomonas_euryale.AAC.2